MNQYVENQLDAAGARALQGHLDVCEECRRQLADIRHLTLRLRGLPRERVGASFVPLLMVRLATPAPEPARGAILLTALAATAGMALLLYPVNYLAMMGTWLEQVLQGDLDAAGLWLSLPATLGGLGDALSDPAAVNGWLASAGTTLQFNLLLGLTLVFAAALVCTSMVMRQQVAGRS